MTHTETPWQSNGSYIYGPDPTRAIVCMVQNPGSKERDFPLVANRDFIVQACNAHDLLVEALERINTMLDGPRAGEAFTSGQIVAIIESALSLVKGARK